MANDLSALGVASTPAPATELTHAHRELIKRAESRPTTPEQRAAFKRHIEIAALQVAELPDPNENQIAALDSHLLYVDEAHPDPRSPLAPNDNAIPKLIIGSVKVADKNGQPRMVANLTTGAQEDFPIARLIAELRASHPLGNHRSTSKLDVASGLAW